MRVTNAFFFMGLDIIVRVKELCGLKCWGNFFRSSSKGRPHVYVFRRNADGTTGLALCDQHRMVIGLGDDCDLAELDETILHELAHLYHGEVDRAHNEKWRRILRAAALELWGVWSVKRVAGDLDLDLAAKIREAIAGVVDSRLLQDCKKRV